MMFQLIRTFIENFSSSDLEYLVVEAPKLTKSPDLNLVDSLVLSKLASSAAPWDDIYCETFPYIRAFPNEPYMYVRGNIRVPLNVIANVDSTVNAILAGNLDLDRFLAEDAALYERGHRRILRVYEVTSGMNHNRTHRHMAAMGDYYDMVEEFRSVVLRVVNERRMIGM